MGVFMRVATFVLGIFLSITGGISQAADGTQNRSSAHRAATMLADGAMASPTVSPLLTEGSGSPSASFYARDPSVRNGLGAMGFVPPSQNSGSLIRSYPFGEPRTSRASERFDPASIPLPAKRTAEDHLLTGFVAVMLIAYQLRRKHRFLRPHQFST
jgi:hypothetical protein